MYLRSAQIVAHFQADLVSGEDCARISYGVYVAPLMTHHPRHVLDIFLSYFASERASSIG